MSDQRAELDGFMYHHGKCDHGDPTMEQMFQLGDLLTHCQALRDSATGMGEPLRHPEWVRGYVRRRLYEWKEPTETWDGHVRALCAYAVAEYHAADGSKEPLKDEEIRALGMAFS